VDLVLGVDGGNSTAIALIARADGSIIGAARRPGSADIYAAEAAALDLLRSVVADALADAKATPSDVATSVFSLAGADWPEDIAFLEASASKLGIERPPIVVNDAIGALTGAVPEGPAVVVSIGTGAATGARAADDTTWHSSFWQVTQGSAELARSALEALARSDLGVEPAPSLTDRVLAALGAPTVEEAVHRLTRRHRAPSESIGVVVRALFEAADAGDSVAERIVARHGIGIGEVAAASARRVGINGAPYALAFCGGVTRGGAAGLITAAVQTIASEGQSPMLTSPRWEPAVGALLIGLRAASGVGDVALEDRLEATMPPTSLFNPGG
jgi:N-acetylglucosamine kinase-like BadF-type ATPase